MILYNPTLQGIATDNHFLPSVHLENDAGTAVLEFLASHAGVTARFPTGKATNTPRRRNGAFQFAWRFKSNPRVSKPTVPSPECKSWLGTHQTRFRSGRQAEATVSVHSGHVHVEPARCRCGSIDQGTASQLNYGADQVGTHDHRQNTGRLQRGRCNSRGSLRYGIGPHRPGCRGHRHSDLRCSGHGLFQSRERSLDCQLPQHLYPCYARQDCFNPHRSQPPHRG